MEFREKALCVAAILVEIDRDHGQAFAAVGVLHCLHPRK